MWIPNIPILAYHQIVNDGAPVDPSGLSVSRSQFEAHMRHLHEHGFRCLSVSEIFPRAEEKPLPTEKAFALTFDDGYEDFYTNAFPILARYGFTATVFLVSDMIGKTSNWDGEENSPLLSWQQIRALHKENISFGSHTHTHPHLPHLSNKRAWYELTVSKQHLEHELGHEVSLFSYPYGESTPEIQKMAEAAGYGVAFGVATGRGGPFNVWRSECGSHDTPKVFAFKLTRMYREMMGMRIFLREETKVGRLIRSVKHHPSIRALRELSYWGVVSYWSIS
ncbi:MAG: polysaccharide deacetylase family protein [Caldilineaceae bacterium]|nr:polysaccharide deacetylase family protein [Caldilineaceae bacterium]